MNVGTIKRVLPACIQSGVRMSHSPLLRNSIATQRGTIVGQGGRKGPYSPCTVQSIGASYNIENVTPIRESLSIRILGTMVTLSSIAIKSMSIGRRLLIAVNAVPQTASSPRVMRGFGFGSIESEDDTHLLKHVTSFIERIHLQLQLLYQFANHTESLAYPQYPCVPVFRDL